MAPLCALATVALAGQPIERPSVVAGDTWVYRTTIEKGPSGWNQSSEEIAVLRTTASTIFYSVKPSGSTQPPKETFAGSDWSRSRDVNGADTVVNRPLSFPLTAGKSWEVSYTEMNPNKAHQSEKFDIKYTVVGWESVDVPAGKFQALKIESDGQWHATVAPNQKIVQGAESTGHGATLFTDVDKTAAREVSGKIYKAFWYVPEVKRWVKSVEEIYAAGGVRSSRYTGELESFKLAD